MVEEITDLAEERRKRGKDDGEEMWSCPVCQGAVWFAMTGGDLVCVTCWAIAEDMQVTKQ